MHILIKDIGLLNYHCNHPQGVHIWYTGINFVKERRRRVGGRIDQYSAAFDLFTSPTFRF